MISLPVLLIYAVLGGVAAALVGWPLAKLLWRLLKKAWPFVKESWGGMMRALASLPVSFLLTIVLYAAMGAAMAGMGPLPKWLFRPPAAETGWANGAIYVAARLGVAVVSSLVLAPLLVSVHRVLLRDRVQAGWLGATTNYFCWLLALQLVALAGFSFALLASAVAAVRGMIDLIVQLGILILAWRLVLLGPAVAIGVPAKDAEDRMEASWTVMEGRFWSTIGLFFCVLLPMLVVMVALARLGLPRPPNPPPISPPPPAPPPVTKLLLIGRGLLGMAEVFAAALAASAASVLYARLKPKQP
jgi:hypothetical protein